MKRALLLCFLLLFPATTHASNTKTILVYGSDLHDVFLLQLNNSDIELVSIDKTTLLKPTCSSKTLATIDSLTSSEECLVDSIEDNFKRSIDNIIKLNLQAIDEDYALSLTASDLQSFANVEAYFDELGSAIDFSVIWKFHEYMDTDLTIGELYDFYNLYTSDTITTTYLYPFLIQINKRWIPLNVSFHPNQA